MAAQRGNTLELIYMYLTIQFTLPTAPAAIITVWPHSQISIVTAILHPYNQNLKYR